VTGVRTLLSPRSGERSLLVRAAFVLAVIRLALAILPFSTLSRCLGATRTQWGGRRPRHAAPRVAWAVEVNSRWIPRTTGCLPRALAAWTLLQYEGHEAQVRIGFVRPAEGGFKAHAWVEHAGKVVIGDCPTLGGFATFPPLPIGQQ